jgi:predicted O-methyltransferase YrrM
MHTAEWLKYVVYRTPVLRRFMSPRYPYKVNPGQLAALLNLIESSRDAGGSVIEIGVAKGDTSVFLLEHLRSVGDERELLLFDTFNGFTAESVDVEVEKRGKSRSEYDKFRYGNEMQFRKNLERSGYTNFRTIRGDASRFDWSTVAPIGAVLLDIDVYAPSKIILENIYPHLCPGGGIVIDDVLEGGPWDGSLQAYDEFVTSMGLPFTRVGHKGAVILARPSLPHRIERAQGL